MPNFSKMKRQMLEPLDDETKKGLQELIEEARPYAENYQKNVWELIWILSKLETRYGSQTILRWAEPLGIHWRTAYRWREVAKGVTREFIDKYGKRLSIAKATVLAQHYVLDLKKIPQEVLEYAVSKDTSATSLAGYINEVNTVSALEIEQIKQEAQYRVGEWATKADLKEVERVQLEQLADEKPELAISLTSDLDNVEAYREYVDRTNALAQIRLQEFIERKAEPKLRRFLESIERDAEDIKQAVKKQADTTKFKRELRDLIKLLQEIDAVVPEIPEVQDGQVEDSGLASVEVSS